MTFNFKTISIMALTSIALSGCLSAEQMERAKVQTQIKKEQREEAKRAKLEAQQKEFEALKAEEKAYRETIAKTRPICQSKSECDSKMEAAYLWVSKNADYRIRSSNSVMIETYGPLHADGDVAMTVEKTALGGGKYALVTKMWCNPRGVINKHPTPMNTCKVNLLQKIVEFNNYVNSY